MSITSNLPALATRVNSVHDMAIENLRTAFRCAQEADDALSATQNGGQRLGWIHDATKEHTATLSANLPPP